MKYWYGNSRYRESSPVHPDSTSTSFFLKHNVPINSSAIYVIFLWGLTKHHMFLDDEFHFMHFRDTTHDFHGSTYKFSWPAPDFRIILWDSFHDALREIDSHTFPEISQFLFKFIVCSKQTLFHLAWFKLWPWPALGAYRIQWDIAYSLRSGQSRKISRLRST